MTKIARASFLVACLAVLFAATRSAQADGTNGGSGPILDDPALVVGANWYATSVDTPPAFFWGAGDGVLNGEGPYTFNAATAVRVDVTDDFNQGDRFQVFDFGASIGLTSLVASGAGGEVGPEAAFNNPLWSSGSFFLPAGAHAITIAAVVNPFNGGRGYLRALPVPEPTSIVFGALAIASLLVGVRVRR